jgi:hypothetical protein
MVQEWGTVSAFACHSIDRLCAMDIRIQRATRSLSRALVIGGGGKKPDESARHIGLVHVWSNHKRETTAVEKSHGVFGSVTGREG